MRRIALLTLLTFGCATVRPPAEAPEVRPLRHLALAEPQLELWMEGTHDVDPRESSAALAASQEALSRALDGRGLDDPDPEAIVVVRARAIARTGERKTAQTWSAVGIVVGIVLVIVAAVVLSKNGGKKGSPAGRGGHAAVPAPSGVGRGRPLPGVYAPRLARPPAVGFFVGFDVFVPVGPYAPVFVPGVEPTDDWLARRGWFDGDAMEITVEVTDAATGEVQDRRVVRDSVDPRDGAAVARLLDRALAGLAEGVPGAPPPAS